MRKSSFSQSLATVNSHSSSHSGSQNSSSVVPHVTPRMKRSPYLSAMTSAGNNNGGEDLVELLSRPNHSKSGAVMGNSGGGGGEGGLQFFQLKRPSSAAVSDGNDITTTNNSVCGDVQMNVTSTTKNLPPTNNNTTSKSNLKSALRINSNLQLSSVPSTTTTTTPVEAGMKKNTSVTFSRNTKHPSRLGMQDSTVNDGGSGGNDHFPVLDRPSHINSGVGGSSGLGGVGLMRKSQSICAPEYLLSHSTGGGVKSGGDGGNATANVSSSSGGGGEGNASFPIYFAKLGNSTTANSDGSSQQHPPQEESVQSSLQNQSSTPPPPSSTTSNEQIRRKSKSMSTLQYSYNQQLLSTHPTNTTTSNTNTTTNKLFGALGINPSSRVNLKFRDMLDEGDGNEGDLNLRLRNQQWKDFRLFSKELESENPMLASIEELNSGGSCRNVTDDEDGGVDVSNEKDGGGSGGVQSSSSTTSLSGSKRAISPSSSSQNPSSRTSAAASFLNSFGSQHRQLNAHRASVSVNDLAMLRRSAARMRVVPSPSSNSSGNNGNFGPTQMAPGATLGGEMLSRISSKNSMSTIPSSNSSVTSVGSNTAALSPLAQMMAKSANLSSKQQQQELFSSRVNSSRPSSQMGRRVHTVGAGLAYGGPNLSRFDLGSLRKDLSIMSGGSGSSGGGGKNEEWDL